MSIVKNPIRAGFYPDPSICEAEGAFYLVNSTFVYFPGVPIFKSSDLNNWEQIGNVLDRNSQIPLQNTTHSQGIYAPTIRYNKGVWYMITTNVGNGDNFLVTASNPAGPWSEAHFLGKEAIGFDPSLMFDDDGKCYYVGTRPNPEGIRYNGDYEIFAQEVDLEKYCLIGESHKLWKGALRRCIWPEGPHLYKINGWYYLLIAEGGTADDHCITIARSREIFGEYLGNPKNPIFTHRHLGRQAEVQYIGHGDLVKTPQDEWYMVMLGIRPQNGYTVLGRETFLARVVWEDEWPVVSPNVGMIENEVKTSLPIGEVAEKKNLFLFYQEKLPFEMMMLRNPDGTEYAIDTDKKLLRLNMKAATLCDLCTPAYVCVRQPGHDFTAECAIQAKFSKEKDCAGLAIMQSDEFHIQMELHDQAGKQSVRVVKCYDKKEEILTDTELENSAFTLQIRSFAQKLSFYVIDGLSKKEILSGVDATFLSTEVAQGFVGCTVGMYASGNGADSEGYAEFPWFFCE